MLSTLRSKLLSSAEEGNNFLSSLKFQSCLGLGGFGIVLKAVDPTSQTDPTLTAIKLIFPSKSDGKEQTKESGEEKQILRECQLASTFNHLNIVKILNVAEKQFKPNEIEKIFKNLSKDDDRSQSLRDMCLRKAKRYKTVESICIQMELCGETLRKWLSQQHDTAEEEVQGMQIRICHDIVAGLKYLHEKKIIHRDLKPENIMFSKSNFTPPVKIGDFGLCRILHTNPESQTGNLTSRTGTLEYMAPEAFSNDYTFQVDLFSLGLVIWEVVQLIKFQEKRILFDGLVNDKNEEVVQVSKIFSGIKEVIINLTKKKTTERSDGLEEVFRTIEELYQNVVKLPVRSSEVEMSFMNVKRGGKIVLCEGVFEGVFLLKEDLVEIVGQGPGKTILRGLKHKTCLNVRGSGCIISGLTITRAKFRSCMGLYLEGSRNRIQNVEVSGGTPCIHVSGDENQLKELTISNAFKGIQIHGSFNTLNQIKILDSKYCGILVAGFYNRLSHINIDKMKAEVWLDSSGSNNSISNLLCSGYSWNKEDPVLRIDSPKSSVKDSDCGPVSVDGRDSSLSNVNCGEGNYIEVNAIGVSLTNCRGQKLVFKKPVVTKNCQFEQITEIEVE